MNYSITLKKLVKQVLYGESEYGGTDQMHCPVCGCVWVHFEKPQYLDGEDGYKARGEMVRGDCIIIPMWCEAGHEFNLAFGFHKGCTFSWLEDRLIDYQEYINSPEWRARARAAKVMAGYRCQICNKKGNDKTLHAHHRTYERLGSELPEDITVLCSDCHAKFHDKE